VSHALVTGASGVIGSELSRYLVKQGHKVDTSRINVRNSQNLQDAFDKHYDSIYHLAALNPFKSNHGSDYFQTNVQGLEKLLQTAFKTGANTSILITSTALVFDPEKVKPHNRQQGLVSEDSLTPFFESTLTAIGFDKNNINNLSSRLLTHFKLKPSDIFYNDSKLLAELIAYAYQKLGLNIKVVRLPNCVGKNANQLPNQFIQDAKTTGVIRFDNKDTQARDYVFYSADSSKDDVLRLLAGINQKAASGFYHISSKGQFVRTPKQLAEAILKLLEKNQATHGASEDSQLTVVMDNHKLKQLGLKPPKTTPEQALKLLC
jgi:nucleoside-diphosphate-sugar epimerase